MGPTALAVAIPSPMLGPCTSSIPIASWRSSAARLEALDRSGADLARLRGELADALFFDNSTRTKSAWAGAGAILGMNAHALGVRHDLILGEGQRVPA
jgi:ornithine carbamoyltransferase